jgi:hypothetical protein
MMSNLTCRKPVDRNLSDPTDGICESFVDGPRIPDVQEPIPVRVRVRLYGESIPEVRQARAEKPDFGQLPVGSILDCYV